MVPRHLQEHLIKSSRSYPLVALLGPRQSGKTTLVKACFHDKAYVNLEKPDHRLFAESDPVGFLRQFPEGAILDEVQRVPDLFSYIQVLSDEKNKKGFFILTGSHNYLLMEKITQSLAGRVALHTLHPFSQDELRNQYLPESVYTHLWMGCFPRVYADGLNPYDWYENYVRTYVERDVRELKQITNLSQFTQFLKMCAARTGQLLNLSSLGNDCGVSHNTVKSWLSVLEASFLIKLLPPYHNNFNKRLVKSPKIHFLDTGLVCYLLGIQKPDDLRIHPLKGGIFESYVVSELVKRQVHQRERYALYFWQDNANHEIDCLLEQGTHLLPLEIKAGETFTTDYLKNFKFWDKLGVDMSKKHLVYAGDTMMKYHGVDVVGWNRLNQVQF